MKKKEPPPRPEWTTAEELADLAGITDRRVRQLADEGVIPKPPMSGEGRGKYPFTACIKGIVGHFREQANGQSADKARDQARQAKADADRAEMAAAKDAGTLMLTADARRMWSDGFVKIRDCIVRSSLTAKQKKELTEKMQKIKVEQS